MYSSECKKALVLLTIVAIKSKFDACASIALQKQWLNAASHVADCLKIGSGVTLKHMAMTSGEVDLTQLNDLHILPSPKDEGIDEVTWLLKYQDRLVPTGIAKPLNDIPVAFEDAWKALASILRDKPSNVDKLLTFIEQARTTQKELSDKLAAEAL